MTECSANGPHPSHNKHNTAGNRYNPTNCVPTIRVRNASSVSAPSSSSKSRPRDSVAESTSWVDKDRRKVLTDAVRCWYCHVGLRVAVSRYAQVQATVGYLLLLLTWWETLQTGCSAFSLFPQLTRKAEFDVSQVYRVFDV